MKKITILFCLSLLTALPACKEKEITPYDSGHGVYFPVEAAKYQYSFIRDPESTASGEHAISVKVTIQGYPKNYDRKFRVSVVPREANSLEEEQPTTAVEGVDYAPLQDHYILKAGEYVAYVPVIVKKTDKLDDEFIRMTLRLDPTEDLILGLKERQRSLVVFGNKLYQPEYWLVQLWGEWSAVKQTTIEEVMAERFPELDMLFPASNEEYLKSDIYPRRSYIAAEMNKWFKDHPTLDENGNQILPWQK